MTTRAPYGSWTSPVSADMLAAGTHPVSGGRFVGDEVWWLELRPDEDGRSAVRRQGADGEPEDLLPAPWNVRTRVHEYGGGAWTVNHEGVIIFAEFADQRLYRLDPTPLAEPTPLTPEPDEPSGLRYAELAICRHGDEVWCIREKHSTDGYGHAAVTRDIVAVPLDGCAVDDPEQIRVLVDDGSHFLAGLRLSPDGSKLAWLAWEHPQMPWDGTQLRVADVVDGRAAEPRVVIGSTGESVLQPEWADDSTLYAISDRTGFWNLYRVRLDGSAPDPLCPLDAEFGGPMWRLGSRWFAVLDDGRLLTVRTVGTDTLAVLDPADGTLRDIELPGITSVALGATQGRDVLIESGGAQRASGLRHLGIDTGELADIRLDADDELGDEYFAEAELMTFSGRGGRAVHAVVYPPRNPDFTAADDERAPYVAFVHGGPTSSSPPQRSVSIAYFTSRGIGVVDVNYGGSTGYGREYRDRLRGQWGVVDVEDTVAAVLGLAERGLADPTRLAIRGGSAGGWTVLSALTMSDAFACGVSYFGVAELLQFAQETHDFESRYLDGLIGPLPEARELYETRAPVNNVDGLSCPVLLLQGLDDPIVPPAQAERFRDALVAKQLPYAYRTYAGESHGFRRRETIIDSSEAELSFYGQIMGFATPGIPAVEIERP